MLNDFVEYREPIKFYINDECSLDYGIKVLKTNILSSPAPSIDYIDIPGRNGSLSVFNGWEDFTLTLECVIVGDEMERMANTVRRAKRFLMSGTENKLQTDEDPDFYLIGTIDTKLDIDEVLEKFTDGFTVSYRCHPHRYYKDSNSITLTNGGSTEINIINDDTKPIITVVGSGDMVLTIGDSYLNVNDIYQSIIVDCKSMDCYKLDSNGLPTISQNYKMYSYFPVLKHGKNNISLQCTDGMKVTINWREVSLY
jgi:Phage-related protein